MAITEDQEYTESLHRAVKHLRDFVRGRSKARQTNQRTNQPAWPGWAYNFVAAHVDNPETDAEVRRDLRKLLASAESNNY